MLVSCQNPYGGVAHRPAYMLLQDMLKSHSGDVWRVDLWWSPDGYNITLIGTQDKSWSMAWRRIVVRMPHPASEHHDDLDHWVWDKEGWYMWYCHTHDHVKPALEVLSEAVNRAREVIVPHHFFYFH